MDRLTPSKTTNFRLLKIQKVCKFANDNFRFDENGEKFSKMIERTVGKGEIARYEQFLLFPQCFQKTVQQTRKHKGLLGKGLSTLLQEHSSFS